MSVSSLQSSTGGLVGNNSTTTAYVVPFSFALPTDLSVLRTDAAGITYTLNYGTDYSVTQNPDQSGGNVFTLIPWAATNTITISRVVPITQLLTLQPGAKEPAAAITAALDKLTYITQQISRSVNRTLRYGDTSPDQPVIYPSPGSVLVFDSTGKAFMASSAGLQGNGPFVLSVNAAGGVPVFQQQATSQIADASVTNSKLAPNSVTGDKLAPNAITPNLIPASSIDSSKLAPLAVTSEKLGANAVTADKIAGSAVSTNQLSDGAVNNAKLGANAITADKIAESSIPISKLDNDANERLFESAPSEVACDGRIQGIAIVDTGSLYLIAPTVTIGLPPTGGIQATAIATLGTGSNAGRVASIIITNKGKGYKSDPSVTFSSPPAGGTMAKAVAYAVVSGLEQSGGNAGGSQECISFIMKDGAIMSVGANSGYGYVGALGEIDYTVLPQPASTGGLAAKFVRLWKAWHNMYALDTTGQLWACGIGGAGALGANNYSSDYWNLNMNSVPAPVVKFATSYGRDNNACLALLGNGQLYGWGYNAQGALGDGTLSNVFNPKIISSPISGIWTAESNITDFALIGSDGSIATFLIRGDGTVRSAGRNDYGQLGHGTANYYEYSGFNYVFTSANTPLTSIKKVVGCGAGTFGTTLFLRTDGTVYACGRGTNGQLGNGTAPANQNYATPCLISGVANIWATGGPAGSTGHIHALKTDGSLWGWGYNNAGQLGTSNAVSNINTPVQVWPASNGAVVKVAQHGGADTGGVMILLADGRMFYSGNGAYGCRGDGVSTGTNGEWVHVHLNRRDIVDINFGSNQDAPVMMILSSTGEVYVCGINAHGTLGNGRAYTQRSMPGRVIF